MTHFSELPDYIEYNELKKYFIDFLICYANNTDERNIYYALSELLELSYRQWHTYEVLDKDIQKQLTKYIKKIIDFDNKRIMHYVLRIIPHIGMDDLFIYIIDNKSNICNEDILKDINKAEEEYGENVDNPYSDM